MRFSTADAACYVSASALLSKAGHLYQGAIFDLDGTLADSMGMWYRIDVEFLSRRGLVCDDAYHAVIKTLTLEEGAHYTIEHFHLDETPQAIIAEWDEMALHAYTHEVKLKKGASSFLRELARRGVPLSLATLCRADMARGFLAAHHVLSYFTSTMDALQSGRGKEFPDIFLEAAASIGLSPASCLVFEDSLQAIKTAKAAGFLVCSVPDALSESEKEAIESLSVFVLPSFDLDSHDPGS